VGLDSIKMISHIFLRKLCGIMLNISASIVPIPGPNSTKVVLGILPPCFAAAMPHCSMIHLVIA